MSLKELHTLTAIIAMRLAEDHVSNDPTHPMETNRNRTVASKTLLRLPENVWPLAFEISALLTCSTLIPWLLRRSLG